MEMLRIDFSHNWNNKLNCPVFSTIRRCTEEKRDYYLRNIGNVFDVMLENAMTHCKAKLVSVDVKILDALHYTLLLDTGTTDIQEAFEIFRKFGIKRDTEVLVLLFKRVSG